MKDRVYRVVLGLLARIPLRLRAGLLEAVAMLIWALDRRHRRIARLNLRIAFPEMGGRDANRIIRLGYRRTGTAVAEFVHFPRMDREYVERHVRFEGMDHLRKTREEKGQAPLVMTAHFGNWELLAHACGTVHFPIAFLVRPFKDPALDRIVTEIRQGCGNRTIPKLEAAREVLRELRDGTLVGILIDQNVDRRMGIAVDFFTKKAYTTFGIARLALAARTNLHAAFLFRDPRRKFHHVLRVGPSIPLDRFAPREEEVARVTRRCNEELEKVIREDPAQWLWTHRRWQTRPPGEPSLYEGVG